MCWLCTIVLLCLYKLQIIILSCAVPVQLPLAKICGILISCIKFLDHKLSKLSVKFLTGKMAILSVYQQHHKIIVFACATFLGLSLIRVTQLLKLDCNRLLQTQKDFLASMLLQMLSNIFIRVKVLARYGQLSLNKTKYLLSIYSVSWNCHSQLMGSPFVLSFVQ